MQFTLNRKQSTPLRTFARPFLLRLQWLTTLFLSLLLQGRHLFSADTLPDMKDWIRKLQSALDQIRNNNRPATSTSSSVKEGGKRRKEDNAENKENVQTATKERKKKKEVSMGDNFNQWIYADIYILQAYTRDGCENVGNLQSTYIYSHRIRCGAPPWYVTALWSNVY